jgi:hypothetical protein
MSLSIGTQIAYELQPYTGSTTDQDPISSKLPFIGQINPYTLARYQAAHGRYLSGMGSTQGLGMNPNEGDAEFVHEDLMLELERDDDVYGSGIFDKPGRADTIHSTLGVFGDHPSVPGYIGREVQFAVSQEVHDVANGADLVTVPAGGMAYVERGGHLVDVEGRPNPFGPYENLNRPHGLPGPCRGCAPGTTRLPREGGVVPMAFPGGTAVDPNRPNDVPSVPQQSGVQYKSSIGGFGATTDSAPGWGAFAAAGALVGVAAAIFVGTLNVKKPRRRRN